MYAVRAAAVAGMRAEATPASMRAASSAVMAALKTARFSVVGEAA